mgnify:CR=1 FL=1
MKRTRGASRSTRLRRAAATLAAVLVVGTLPACGGGEEQTEPFTIGAIPDQDPEVLQRLYGTLSDYLERELGVPVRYEPVTDYAAAVTAFRVGDLDMVWFGGLTGVQARLQVPGAEAILQRGIDDEFHSVFIANTSTDLAPVDTIAGLRRLAGHTFTFGSEISTSGRLMPQYFLQQAGVDPDDFEGEPGFSGSHDKTIQLVQAGSYDAGALNAQVWESRLSSGRTDTSKVQVIWRTSSYYDYHWVIRPGVSERYGDDFVQRVEDAFTGLSAEDGETEARILEMFGAEAFVPTENANYEKIEQIGRQIGKIR